MDNLQDVTSVMHLNIDSVLNRGESLENLVEKSESLSSMNFYVRSSRRSMQSRKLNKIVCSKKRKNQKKEKEKSKKRKIQKREKNPTKKKFVKKSENLSSMHFYGKSSRRSMQSRKLKKSYVPKKGKFQQRKKKTTKKKKSNKEKCGGKKREFIK
jgi:hypothetical protein